MKMRTLSLTFFAFFCLSAPASAIEVKFEQDNAIPMVSLNVAVKAGTAHDPEGQYGISNFMGEMLLRGTTTRTKAQLDLALDQIGAVLEVEARSEALIFRGTVISSKLAEFMEILNDILVNPRFPEVEIQKLKREIVSQILNEQGKDTALARSRWEKFLFNGHPYGKPIIGKLKDIERLTRKQIMDHYGRFIQDRNLLVAGAGDAEESFVKAWADRLAEKRPDSKGENPMSRVSQPQQPIERRLVLIDKPERTQTQIYLGQIGVRLTDPSFFPLYLGNHAFGGGSFSARMMVEIRAKRGWSYGAYSYFRHGLRPRSWQAYYFPATKDTPDALAYGVKMIGELKDRGISEEEYVFAKTSLVNSAGFMYNTPKKRVENILLERTLDLPDGFMKSYASQLSKISREQVNGALKNFLKPETLSILVLGTAKDLKDPLAKAVGMDVKDIQIVPYTQE